MTLRAVLLDLGGPVLNEDAECEAWEQFLRGALAPEGLAVPEPEFAREVRTSIVRSDPNSSLPAVWASVGPDVEQFRRIRTAFEGQRASEAELRGVEVRPEAWEVIPTLAQRFPLANQPLAVLSLLKEATLLEHFRGGMCRRRWAWPSLPPSSSG